MKTGYRAHAVVHIDPQEQVTVVEVLPELSAAVRLAEMLSEKHPESRYLLSETSVRYGRSKPMPQKDAKRMIIEEWNKRSPEQRTKQDMFGFFSEIHSSMPELTGFKTKADPWQLIHAWLLEEEEGKEPQQNKD